MPGSANNSQQTFHGEKRHFPATNETPGTVQVKISFTENPTTLTIFKQSPTQHHFFDEPQFVQYNYSKAPGPSISEHPNFDQCLFNSRSNMLMTLVNWISRHPKMALLLTFLG